MTISHYVLVSSTGVICHKCRKQPAKHKVAEVMPDDVSFDSPYNRHELTAYLCCGCFGELMGGLAIASCKADNSEDVSNQIMELFTTGRGSGLTQDAPDLGESSASDSESKAAPSG